jgi:hypothetical protein
MDYYICTTGIGLVYLPIGPIPSLILRIILLGTRQKYLNLRFRETDNCGV